MSNEENTYQSKVVRVAQKFGIVGPGKVVAKKDNETESTASVIDQILTGWGNYIKSQFMDLTPALRDMSEERLSICHQCDMRRMGTCDPTKSSRHVKTGVMTRGCGCNLAAKALSPNSECPLGKW